MKIAYWIFLLIGLYLLIAYYKGTVNVFGALSDFIDRSILFLQARNTNGSVNNYPQDGAVTQAGTYYA